MSVADQIERLASEITEQTALIQQVKGVLAGKTAGGEPVIQPLTVAENGTYTPPDGVDGFSPVVVEVPEREVILQDKSITANGSYAADEGYDGFGRVTVNVPVPDGYIKPVGTLDATENGTYDVTAYAAVVVDVPIPDVEPDFRDFYQRVEYIESAEEETYPYFITDFYADNSAGVEVVASFPILQDRIPMGSRENSDATRFYCVYPMSSSSIYYGFNTGSSISCQLKADTVYRCQTNFLNSRLVNVYDEAGIRKGGTSISATLVTQTAPVSIFGYNSASSGNVSSKREYKLFSARCSRGHEVVREYIPCRRKSDGMIGLFEKVTGQFLEPAFGVFAAGPDIDW